MKRISQKDLDTIATYMDDDLREQVASELAPCEPEEFLIRVSKRRRNSSMMLTRN